MVRTSPWQTKEEWIDYGIKHGYEMRNPNSFYESEKNLEKKWYNRGTSKKWIKNFNFKRKRSECNKDIINLSFEDWISYGVKHSYEERNPTSLADSKDPIERSWYYKGSVNKWLDLFNFKRKYNKWIWKTKIEWIQYGCEKGYDKKNRTSLEKSNDKEEYSWYRKGLYEKWLCSFDFKKKKQTIWKTKEEWIKYGIENKYDNRCINSFIESDDKTENSWYYRGRYKKWLKDFNFKSQAPQNITNSRLENLLEEYIGDVN